MFGGDASVEPSVPTKGLTPRVNQLSEPLGIPIRLNDLGKKDFKKFAKDVLAEAWRSYAVPNVMRRKDVKVVLQSAADGTKNITFA